MKSLFGVIAGLLLISAPAFSADVSGRAELTLWPDFGGSFLEMDIRQEGSKILGRTFYGNGLVNLEVNNGRYRGFAGGTAATDLTCTEAKCEGVIDGRSSNFSTTVKETSKGREVTNKGTVNFNFVTVKRTAKKISVSGEGSMEFNKVRDGVYEGRVYVTRGARIRTYTARLETSGSLLNLDDAALFNIFVVSPFNERAH